MGGRAVRRGRAGAVFRAAWAVCILCLIFCLPAAVKAGEIDPLSDAVDDGIGMFAAPASWGVKDWALTAAGVGAVLASSAWDRPMFGQWSGNNDGLADFGNAYAFAGPGGAMLLYGAAALLRDDARARNTAWELGEAALLSSVLTGAFKVAVGRERPNARGNNHRRFHPGSFSDDRTSFPSGHTELAFSMAGVLQDADLPVVVKAASFALAGVSAWARVHDNRHWVSDTVAGALIGYGVARFVVRRNAERGVNMGYILPRIYDGGWGVVWLRTF